MILERLNDMCTTNIDIIYTVSKHAKERYTERIMDKATANEINTFLVQNDDKIVNDINKMIQYGELIYTGKQTQKDGRSYNVEVYLNGLWVIIVDVKSKNVITLYRIDLGVDEEFNLEYVDRMMNKFNAAKENLEFIILEVDKENDSYKTMIDQNIALINEYKGYIKNLEELNAGYKTIIDNNAVKVRMADREAVEVLNKLIGKKEF